MIQKVKSILQRKAYFLLLLPMFFIVHGYNAFFGFFPIAFVVKNFIITVTLTFIFFILSRLLLKDKHKAAVFCFLFIAACLFFGPFHDFLKRLPVAFFSRYIFLLPAVALLFLFVFLYIKRQTKHSPRFFLFANILFISLLLVEAADAIVRWNLYKKGSNYLDNRFTAFHKASNQFNSSGESNPDIFLLLFDAMPSTTAMKQHWQFDNSRLDSGLTDDGFHVNSFSKSNYNLTSLSVSTMLNMDYCPPVDLYQDETKMYFKASASILDNSLTRLLEKNNYSVFQYQPVSFINNDWKGNILFPRMLTMNYFYQTLPGRMYRDMGWMLNPLLDKVNKNYIANKTTGRNIQHQNDLQALQILVEKSCSRNDGKKFVYAHFQLPHEPYIYDSTGKLKPALQTINYKEEDEPVAFMQQVKFADSLILHLTKYIKAHNKSNTVIIVAGDHGFRNVWGKKGYMIFDNFSAFYFPDGKYESIAKGVSPVNYFRVVLNKYFNTSLPVLKDSSIFIPYTLPGEK